MEHGHRPACVHGLPWSGIERYTASVMRAVLFAWIARLVLPVGIWLLTAGGGVVPQLAAAQDSQEAPGRNLVPVPGAAQQAARMRGRIPCAQVISRLDRNLRAERGRPANVEDPKERAATVATIAKQTGTTRLWVAQCMRAYGRRVPPSLEGFQNEDLVEEFEEQESEESGTEDLTEPGGRERNPISDENSQDRQRIRAADPNWQQKETLLRPHLEDSQPDTGTEGFNEGYGR